MGVGTACPQVNEPQRGVFPRRESQRDWHGGNINECSLAGPPDLEAECNP